MDTPCQTICHQASLVPSSTKILDSVKNQLKSSDVEVNKRQPTKVDGMRFKHDDDEILPSSRNRRKTFTDVKEIEGNKETIENLKKLIHEKRILLDAEKFRNEEHASTLESERLEDMRKIES